MENNDFNDMTQIQRPASAALPPAPALVLQVQSHRSQPLAAALMARFGVAGGTLGRAPGNDLVLDDASKYISRSHARIHWRDAAFYLVDVGANPSIVNDRPLGAGVEAQLNDGDSVVIGDYLLLATLETVPAFVPSPVPSPAPAPAPATAPPLAEANDIWSSAGMLAHPLAPPVTRQAARDVGPTDALAGAGILRGELGSADMADPLGLNLFGGLSPTLAPASPSGSGQYTPPAFRGAENDHVAPELQALTIPSNSAAGIPADYDPLADFLPPRASTPAAVPAPAVATLAAAARATFAPAAPPLVVPAPAAPVIETPPAPPPAADSAILQALLEGLGLPELRSVHAPEVLALEVGRMLRAATAGTMNVLLARALTKRESHIDMTMIAPRANNPLKFFPDADTALTQMLSTQIPGYLPPVAAIESAFEDLQAHELAVIAGMRAALAAVVQRFDPARIEQRLSAPGRMARLLPAARKASMWDRLVELYGELARDADEDLQRLFGEKFSVAYEQQVARLRSERS